MKSIAFGAAVLFLLASTSRAEELVFVRIAGPADGIDELADASRLLTNTPGIAAVGINSSGAVAFSGSRGSSKSVYVGDGDRLTTRISTKGSGLSAVFGHLIDDAGTVAVGTSRGALINNAALSGVGTVSPGGVLTIVYESRGYLPELGRPSPVADMSRSGTIVWVRNPAQDAQFNVIGTETIITGEDNEIFTDGTAGYYRGDPRSSVLAPGVA